LARSANRGVFCGICSDRGGVATLGNCVGGATFRGAVVVEIGFFPLYGCLLAGFLLASCIVMVAKVRRSGFRVSMERENMRKAKSSCLLCSLSFASKGEREVSADSRYFFG